MDTLRPNFTFYIVKIYNANEENEKTLYFLSMINALYFYNNAIIDMHCNKSQMISDYDKKDAEKRKNLHIYHEMYISENKNGDCVSISADFMY